VTYRVVIYGINPLNRTLRTKGKHMDCVLINFTALLYIPYKEPRTEVALLVVIYLNSHHFDSSMVATGQYILYCPSTTFPHYESSQCLVLYLRRTNEIG
jgi:hypothetical protein